MERATRYSKKREAILDVIRGTYAHPSAEWIYQALKPAHPDLSLGTVYRNLLFFQRQGTIQSVGVVHGQERFDAVTTPHSHFVCNTCGAAVTTPHSHFVCNTCGAVIDLHGISMDANLNRAVREQYGFEVDRHELTFYGKCQACMQAEKNEEDVLA